MSTSIYVGNLPYSYSDESLRELFSVHGEIISAKIIYDKMTRKSKGFGFIEMVEENHATSAIEQLDNSEVNGRRIKVSLARSKRTFNEK